MTDNGKPDPPDNGESDSLPSSGITSDKPLEPEDALEKYEELFLRKAAEFDNYRKRVKRERDQQTRAATENLIGDILPLLDDFERALSPTIGDGHDVPEAYRNGIELIYKQLFELLRKRGVTRIETTKAKFDPNVHEAVIYEPSEGYEDGDITTEIRRGYMLGDKLLRAPMVKVAKA